jgi:glycosyltransferase involved in cell wall biosynthesis
MRVALDGTPLTLASGGLRRYVAELSCALAGEFPGDTFLLASNAGFKLPEGAPANLAPAPGPGNAIERRWWSWGVNRLVDRERIDVFHGTNFEVPYLPARPGVLTLHDLSPWDDVAERGRAQRVRSRTPALIRLGIAGMIITPTETIRRQAIETFRIHPDRVVAVPEAAAASFEPAGCVPAAPYFLYVGAVGHRKNVATAIEAWREVRKRHAVDLVLAGDERADFFPEPGFRALGVVDDRRLAELYSGAVALLYPSLYEGFGLPVLEAMQCGAAVITSRDPAVAEVAGDAAVRLDARDVRAWAEAMAFAVENPEWLADLRAKSLERARGFSWRNTARLTRDVYDEAIRRFGA